MTNEQLSKESISPILPFIRTVRVTLCSNLNASLQKYFYLNMNCDEKSSHEFCNNSHPKITAAIYLSQLKGYMGFSAVVKITPCEHLHCIEYNLSSVINNHS